MSAYLVDDITINKIVTYLDHELQYDDRAILGIAQKYGIDLTSDNWQAALAQAMYDLNCQALYQRYGDEQRQRAVPYRPEVCNQPIAVFKSLQCWLYQCMEGDAPRT